MGKDKHEMVYILDDDVTVRDIEAGDASLAKRTSLSEVTSARGYALCPNDAC